MSGEWRCPCGDTWMSYKCGCGNDYYRTDNAALNYDGTLYEGPRLCPYNQYSACLTPDVCHGNLINGHCAYDTNFKPRVDTTFFKTGDEAKLHPRMPMIPDRGVPYNIEPKGKGGVVSFERRTEEEIWSSPYCAVNRGACAIEDSESGETCRGVGFCIWRLASETFNPWAVDLCIQNTDNIITESAAVGTHSPHYHEDANRYKEKHMATREQAYDDAMHKALEEDQRKLDVLTHQQDVPLATTIYHDSRNPKDIAGSTKPQYHLVPVTPGMVHVMELGAKKYGPYNWREKKIAVTAYISACMRHMKAFMDREDFDPESHQLHIEHAAMCMTILADAIEHDSFIDDRPYNPKVKS